MAEAQTPQIFLSYARADGDFADRLDADLRAHGQQTWVDRMHLEGGDDWAERIGHEVARSACMIVVLSPEAVASKWVRREITLADERDLPIIPLLFKPVSQVPLQIAERQYIDFTTAYDQSLRVLLQALVAVFQREHHTIATPPAPQRAASSPSPELNTIAYEAMTQLAPTAEDPDNIDHNLKRRASEERQRITRRRFFIAGAGITVAAIATPLSIIGWNDLQAYQRDQANQTTILKHHIFTYRGHSDFVNCVAWSPNSQRIASASDDVTVQVWNARDGSNVLMYHGHSDSEYSVAWSPDGTFIASANLDKTVRVWNARDGSDAFTYQGHSDIVFGATWSPDGALIASASSDDTARVWNASDGSVIFTYQGHSGAVNSVAWSLDGTRIASGGRDKTVQVWHL